MERGAGRRAERRRSGWAAAALLACALLAPDGVAAQQRALRGDVNGDGAVTAADALLVMAHVVGKPLPPGADALGAGDADGNGRLTVLDALVIMGYAVGRDVSAYPVGTPLRPDTPDAPEARLALLSCQADVAAGQVTCEPADPAGAPAAPGAEGPRRLIVGGQNVYVRLVTALVSYDTLTEEFRARMAVQNLLSQPLGTHDGTTYSGQGVRVFFHQPPTVTSGTGVIDVLSADGTGTFTAAGQQFMQYSVLLPPGGTTALREWVFGVPRSVLTFTFQLYVSAAVPFEEGWIDVSPGADTVAQGATRQLSPTVRNAVGGAVPGAVVTWSTSDTLVARVTSTGLVTAAGRGTATLTASSGGRTGTAQVLVPGAPAAVVVMAADSLAPVDAPLRVTARVVDDDSVPIPQAGLPVAWSVAGGGGSFAADTTETDSAGVASVLFTPGQTVGAVYSVSASAGGASPGTSPPIRAVAGAAAVLEKVDGDAQADTVDATLPVEPLVRVKDVYGNVVSETEVVFAVTAGGGAVAVDTVLTDTAGLASAGPWTLGPTAGAQELTVRAGTAVDTFTATAGRGAAALLQPHAGDDQRVPLGEALPTAPAVRVTDRNGNPVPGVEVTFAAAAGHGTATETMAASDSLGLAAVGSWTVGGDVGTDTLTATAEGLPPLAFTAVALEEFYATTFDTAFDNWWTYQWPFHPDSLPANAATCGRSPFNDPSAPYGCQVPLAWHPDGYADSRSQWWIDENHQPPGYGFLNLVAVKWVNHHWGGFGRTTMDFTNARVTFRIRADSLVLAGGHLHLWVQTMDTAVGKHVNYIYSALQIDTLLPDGQWVDVAIDLRPDDALWTCIGSAPGGSYGCSDTIATVLRDLNADYGLIIIPVPGDRINGPLTSGSVKLDATRLYLGAPQPSP